MKNNQKGFVNVVLIGAAAILIVVVGYFVLNKKSADNTKNQASNIDSSRAMTFKLGKIEIDTNQVAELQKSVDEGHQPWRLEPVWVAQISLGIGAANNNFNESVRPTSMDTKKGVAMYVLPYDLKLYEVTVIQPVVGKNKIWVVSEIEEYVQPVAKPSICKQDSEITPVISSISSSSVSIGDTIAIHGCNLAGFEGDNYIWIENKERVKGILYGARRNDNENIEITLKSSICKVDNSYKADACDDKNLWFNLTPGIYKIYTIPWSKKSNEVSIMIK